ncbi:MAG: DDE-type integrase/transposase/recombinase [Nanoarchaeota archaeon]|nr:DDE-type integrase/transposase/recombinase [Nanoarchaeota archaeon]MBU1854547.1 DDE-type integrase/transposase/recombinase [Nanoarchaeota archaeon]
MAYSFKKKRYCVRQAMLGITPIRELCRNRKVPKTTLYRWIEDYKKDGWKALENKSSGAPELEINPQFEELVVNFWKENKYGSGKTWFLLKKQGYTVSQRQIQKIFNKHSFKTNRRKRPSQIKYTRYERSKPNELWHTDWSNCPFTGKNIIAFIDDHSRYLIHAEIFEHQTTENTLIAFEKAIRKTTIPAQILTDNGTQFTPARTEAGPFTKWCEERGIKHILGRVHHPQTNGKIERWFGTYKTEFDERFETLDAFLTFYNEIRIHQSLEYKKPIDKFSH